MNVNAIPKGWHSITPRLFVRDPKLLVAFLKRAFRATGTFRADRPSEIRIGDSLVMISGVRPDGITTSAWLYLYDADADKAYARALRNGATSVEAPNDTHYGDRRAAIKDPCGNVWQIATHRENVSSSEIRRRQTGAPRRATRGKTR